MAGEAAVGVDDDLASRQSRITHRPAGDEGPGGVDVDVLAAPVESRGIGDGVDDKCADVGLELFLVDPGGMLGGDDDVLERDGGVAVVAEGELGLPSGRR